MNTPLPTLPELNQRHSTIAFDAAREIEPEKLDALWAAAQWAPSASNKQDWHYYAIMGAARAKLADVLSRGNQWALAAPLILCVVRNTAVEPVTESRAYGMYDVALSVMCLAIEAEHQGLHAHQMAGFNEEKFREALKLPANEVPVVMVAIGYEETHLEKLDATLQEKMARPRTRKPIEEVVTVMREL
jgi:nitroreductase